MKKRISSDICTQRRINQPAQPDQGLHCLQKETLHPRLSKMCTMKILITARMGFITKTYLYNLDPLKPNFYIVKLYFSYSAQNIDEAVLTSTYNLCFEQKFEKYQNFYLKIFILLVVKFSIYLNRRVFVMKQIENVLLDCMGCTGWSESVRLSYHRIRLTYHYMWLRIEVAA